MATIKELERRAVEIREAEVAAVRRLIGDVRDVAVELPEGSRLAVDLAVTARRLEEHVNLSRARYAMNPLNDLERELREDRERDEGEG